MDPFDVVGVDTRVRYKSNRMVDSMMVVPDIGYPQVGLPLVRQYGCTGCYVTADKQQ